jgi:hypothetical protein
MFDPTVARFTSQDPDGFAAGDPNLYRFVGNHPTNATDPSGLVEETTAQRDNRYQLGQQSRSYWGALATVQSFKTFKRFGETTSLYEKDSKYKTLVDEYFEIAQELFAPRIYAIEAAPGGAYPENYQFWDVTLFYVESSANLQKALPAEDRKIIAGVLLELQQQILTIQQQEPPSVQILEGLGEAGIELLTAPLHLHEVPGALYELATNSQAQAALAQHVKDTIKEIGEGNWKTITKVVVNIPVAVSGVGAAANATKQVTYLSIKLSKAAAQRIAIGGLKAKDLLKELLAASREERAANAPKGINGTIDRSYAQTPQQKLNELTDLGVDAANAKAKIPAKYKKQYDSIPESTWNESRNGTTLRERYQAEVAEQGANARSPQEFVDSHLTRWASADGGPAFENAAKQAMGAPIGPGSKPAKLGNTRPDLYDPKLPKGGVHELPLADGTMLQLEGAKEVKGWEYLKDNKNKYDTYQLRTMADEAHANGHKFNLIISTETDQIASNVLDLVRGSKKSQRGKIVEFNPETGKFKEIDFSNIEAGEPWKRFP